jgi:hypothetical protein
MAAALAAISARRDGTKGGSMKPVPHASIGSEIADAAATMMTIEA